MKAHNVRERVKGKSKQQHSYPVGAAVLGRAAL
jgi:hypothetical protein